MRMLPLLLGAVKPPAVALAQPPGAAVVGIGGEVQPLDVMSRAPTVTFAWNVVLVTRRLLFWSRSAKPPFAFVLIRKRTFPWTSSCTCAPATAAPPWVTRPANVTIFRVRFVTLALSATEPGPTNDSVCTVRAAFGRPVPAAYGVKVETHRVERAGGVSTPVTVKVASRSCAPFGERPGVFAGTSTGPRHVSSFVLPSAASAPVVGVVT